MLFSDNIYTTMAMVSGLMVANITAGSRLLLDYQTFLNDYR